MYRDSRVKDKTVEFGNPYADKTTSLYWNGPLVPLTGCLAKSPINVANLSLDKFIKPLWQRNTFYVWYVSKNKTQSRCYASNNFKWIGACQLQFYLDIFGMRKSSANSEKTLKPVT